MKFIYWLALALVIFNGMILVVNSIGIFNESYTAEDLDGNLTDYEEGTLSPEMIFFKIFGIRDLSGINPIAIAVSIIAIGGAVALAYLTHSPIPLVVGAFAAFFAGIWMQTYGVLHQFGINHTLLGLGTLALGIMVVITGLEMASGGHST